MKHELLESERLEAELFDVYRSVAELPDGVPEPIRVKLLREALAECKEAGSALSHPDCPLCQMMAATENWVRHFDFCSGWCPSCELLDYCETATEQHPAAEREWMRANNDYPADYNPF